MTDYKFQELLYGYQLDMAKLPVGIYMKIEDFIQASVEARKNKEANLLLEKLDQNLCNMITDWVKANGSDLNSIICLSCRYKAFYSALFEQLVQSKNKIGSFKGGNESLMFELTFLSEGLYGNNTYYSFNVYVKDTTHEHDLRAKYRLMVNHTLKVVQPVFVIYLLSGEMLDGYDYYKDYDSVDWEAQNKLNEKMNGHLFKIMIPFGLKLYPLKNRVSIDDMILKLKEFFK